MCTDQLIDLSHTVAYEELLNDHKLEGKIFLPLDAVVAQLLTLVDQATIVKTSLMWFSTVRIFIVLLVQKKTKNMTIKPCWRFRQI